MYDHDLNVVSLSFTCYCVNMCIHLCSGGKLLFTASYSMYNHDLICGFSFLHLLLCELGLIWFMSAGKVLFIWSAFKCLISILYMIMVLNVVSLSSTCYCVNVCIHLRSGCKLLFTASYSMHDHDLKFGFFSSTCYCVNVCFTLCLEHKLLFSASYSMHDHDLKCGFSFLHLLLCEHVHSLMLRQ